MRDLALTSSCLPLFIVANKTENKVCDRKSNPGPLAWEASTLALSHALLMALMLRNYASLSWYAIRSVIAPAHFSPRPWQEHLRSDALPDTTVAGFEHGTSRLNDPCPTQCTTAILIKYMILKCAREVEWGVKSEIFQLCCSFFAISV